MAIEKDLSLISQEDLVLKFGEDMKFTIPMEPKMAFISKLANFEDKVNTADSAMKQLDMFVEMAALILDQDDSKEVSQDFVKENLSMNQIKSLIKVYQSQSQENQANPN